MNFRKICFYLLMVITFCIILECVNSHSIPIRSDVIVTKWPQSEGNNDQDDKQPGWMRRQLMKFGQVTSRLGNAMGTHAVKITSAIDKICEVIKTIIPLLAAVCHVGQFKFCAATTQAPNELSQALNPSSLDLDALDK